MNKNEKKMKVNTKYEAAPSAAPVVIEQVWAEKPGGGIISNPANVVKQGSAVAADGNRFKAIKAYVLVKAVQASDETIQIAKGSGVVNGDVIGHGKKAVACTAVDTSNEAYDSVTVTLGVDIAKGVALYEAKAASANAAAPKDAPVYIVGNDVPAGEGDYAVRLINGCNLRKETAPVAEEIVALMKGVNLV